MKSSQNLYLNASKTVVVKEGDGDAAFLFISAGKTYTKAEVDAINPLVDDLYEQAAALIEAEGDMAEEDASAEQLPAEEAPEAETKEVDGPEENKARRRG